MGAVYEVEHTLTGEHLALKTLLTHVGASPAMVERFKREARVSASVRSDHIVKVVDADVAPELDGASFLVMELLDGSDLDALLENRPATTTQVIEWMLQMSRGLDKAHAAGIIHRDLKPENLFLTRREDGSPLVKILDFGIARIADDRGQDKHRTETGSVFGTPRYMAPEQAKGEISSIGPVTDIWAVGMIVFRLLSGRDYWDGEVATHVLAQIIYEPILPPSQRGLALGDAFDAWFLRSCCRDRDGRFQRCGEQIHALVEALGGVVPERVGARPSGEDFSIDATVRAPPVGPASTQAGGSGNRPGNGSDSLVLGATLDAAASGRVAVAAQSEPGFGASSAAASSTRNAPVVANAGPTISSMAAPSMHGATSSRPAFLAAVIAVPIVVILSVAGWAMTHGQHDVSRDPLPAGSSEVTSSASATVSNASNTSTPATDALTPSPSLPASAGMSAAPNASGSSSRGQGEVSGATPSTKPGGRAPIVENAIETWCSGQRGSAPRPAVDASRPVVDAWCWRSRRGPTSVRRARVLRGLAP